MKKSLAFLSLLAICPTPLDAREFSDREPPRRPCNTTRVNECVQQHRNAMALVQSWINTREPLLQAALRARTSFEEIAKRVLEEKNAIDSAVNSLQREVDFLRAKPGNKPIDLIPGALTLEDFFRVEALQRDWRERYSPESADLLSKELEVFKKKQKRVDEQVKQISKNYTQKDNEFKAAEIQKNTWLDQLRGHYRMTISGCAEHICPPNY